MCPHVDCKDANDFVKVKIRNDDDSFNEIVYQSDFNTINLKNKTWNENIIETYINYTTIFVSIFNIKKISN